MARRSIHVTSIDEVILPFADNRQARQFWAECFDDHVLYTSPERILALLAHRYTQDIGDKYDMQANRVLRALVARILDVALYDPERPIKHIVTLHQFLAFFSDEERQDMSGYVEELAGEMWIIGRLKSGNPDIVIKTILSFRKCLPPMECLKVLALLLISDMSELKETADSYLRNLASNRVQRSKAIIIFVEGLEDRNADVRCAACMALRILKAREATDQLVFMAETDSSHVVKATAKETLQSFGEEATSALHDAELSTHGFQGLHVNRL